MRFTVVTILPELIESALAAGVVGRAREAGVIAVDTINPRDFTSDRHRTVDDTPYGGGPGMVMKAEPLLAAIARAAELPGEREVGSGNMGVPGRHVGGPGAGVEGLGAGVEGLGAGVGPPREPAGGVRRVAQVHRILVTPAGTPLTQAHVRELAALPHVILVCGRYEGIDERVIDMAIDEQLSIGDYVLSGGELAALVVIDAVARFVPGVLGEASSVDEESHSAGLLEYPQYTRPLVLSGAPGTSDDPAKPVTRVVPAILTSGNHAAIAAWRRKQAIERTAQRRPDLFARFRPTAADRKVLPPPLHTRTHLALVHHPVVDRTGAVITTALTNFDIHDLARSSLTYGLAGYHIVTPITSQRDKAAHIAKLWIDDAQGEHRARALALVRTAESIEAVIAELTAGHGIAPVVVATSARAGSFTAIPRRTPSALLAEASTTPAPLLILLGTGWGLADTLIPSVSRMLAPIEGVSEWNHLSVRSAGAIVLDRLFGG
ncbi:MAG TPA: tRNA (guanosine(37)-N1)-methyltransferase TrmD [Kofleriaceae bacterium]|nr:tRNA (guanosine(37)-N1)-methyltransferase TrmD [Kofleriaceae bacterium]